MEAIERHPKITSKTKPYLQPTRVLHAKRWLKIFAAFSAQRVMVEPEHNIAKQITNFTSELREVVNLVSKIAFGIFLRLRFTNSSLSIINL